MSKQQTSVLSEESVANKLNLRLIYMPVFQKAS